jgi:tellurite resistance protein TehA-like permease
MTPALLMSVVGVAAAAVDGGLISNKAKGISTRLAVPQLVVSYLLLSITLFLARMFYPIFVYRLMATSWPKPPTIADLAILVSCDYYFGYWELTKGYRLGLKGKLPQQSKSSVKRQVRECGFAQYAQDTFLTQEVRQVINGASILFALLLIGLAIFWLFVAPYGVIDLAIIRREFTYTP